MPDMLSQDYGLTPDELAYLNYGFAIVDSIYEQALGYARHGNTAMEDVLAEVATAVLIELLTPYGGRVRR